MPNPFSIRPSDLLYLTQHRLCAETLYILNWYKPRYNLSPTYNYTTHYIDSDTGTGTGTGIGIGTEAQHRHGHTYTHGHGHDF